MVNTKVIVLIIALSVVVALIAGIAFSQFASAQANASRNVIGQTSQGTYGAIRIRSKDTMDQDNMAVLTDMVAVWVWVCVVASGK